MVTGNKDCLFLRGLEQGPLKAPAVRAYSVCGNEATKLENLNKRGLSGCLVEIGLTGLLVATTFEDTHHTE